MSSDELSELKRQVDEIHGALLGSFTCEGLISRISKVESWKSSVVKVLIFFGTTLVGLVAKIISDSM